MYKSVKNKNGACRPANATLGLCEIDAYGVISCASVMLACKHAYATLGLCEIAKMFTVFTFCPSGLSARCAD